ncbi:MAG: exodeoxyribonuclease VII small subunit [Candidatus Kerfeldbacteria bacterium]|nr:exodeoxyribonuclease VII small subunit [Candidatus Kerfeldbacteria bacterium]
MTPSTSGKKSPTFGEAFTELEKITADLESDSLDLDQALTKFERGLALSQQLKDKLRTVEQRVEKIREKFDQVELPDDTE